MIKIFKKYGYRNTLMISAFLMLFTACKKDPAPAPTPAPPVAKATRTELTKDSIFLYAKETYFWNTSLPSADVFNARSYADFDAELSKIRSYKIDPATGKAIDKYSFLDDGSLSSQLGGVSGDYGFSANFNNGDRSDLRIRYSYPGSPAALANVKRGQRIIKLNGSSDVNGNSEASVNFLNNAIFGNNASVSMTLRNPDGTTFDVNITRGSYSLNPILYKNVFTAGTKKVGYLVFNSFTTNASAKLDEVFTEFTTAGISEVIVDLRYNGGGSVGTADVLTNLIAPTSASGSLMYTTYWTQHMQDGLATILKNQKFYANGNDGVRRLYSYFDYDYKPTESAGNVERFQKRGAANISRAYFIVTGSTASASELVINNLRPVMDVKLIGRKTYGKPVGFFAIHIDQLDLYIPQFQTKNSQNFGDYFDGLPVDREDFDDIGKDFGDPSERLLAHALSYAQTGNFLSVKSGNDRISSIGSVSRSEVDRINERLNEHEFKGMVETKMKLKLKN
ncbi:S41 family peptidase [Daejeonella oryzae]|uniref:S41 family peptidase n=1 Tax=Daejeonella oryzae TaxID=1122943 RepID=UPI000413950D|nr:S41 family peptidase [Daejeonella oryzae]